MRKLTMVSIALALVAMVLPGCSAPLPGPGGQSGGVSNFRLLVSDAPNDIGDFYSVNVTISRIGVLSADSVDWTEIGISPPRSVDLTKLVGDNASEVWNGSIPSGNYTKVFVYVDSVEGILKGAGGGAGDSMTVKLPGEKLQISRPFSVNQTAGSSIVSFVFDITIIKAGNSGKYILKPQIGESGPAQPFVDVTEAALKHEKESGDKTRGPKR